MANQKLTKAVEAEINRLKTEYGYDETVLREFVLFVLTKPTATPKTKSKATTPKVKTLNLTQLKQAIYSHFQVKTTPELKKSGAFQLAVSGIDGLNLSKKDGWEILYRKLIGVLPGEDQFTGYGCINGIDIFKYDMPWKAFGLDSQTATTDDIKQAYRALSKVYHPDNSETGDAKVFDRLTVFYKSLTERF